MDDAGGVRMAQPVEQLANNFANLADFIGHLLLQVLRERFAVDQFHDDVGNFIVLAVIVNLHDTRMNEPADRLRLVAKALHDVLEIFLAHGGFGDCLDRHRPRNRLVEPAENAAHPAFAQDVPDVVLADFLGNRHRIRQAASATSAGGWHGSQMTNRVPVPTSDSTSMRPPCCCTILYEIDRPSPVPLPISFVEKKGSKILGNTSGAMPPPSSSTSTTTPSPSLRVVSMILP